MVATLAARYGAPERIERRGVTICIYGEAPAR
jgi:hypothetical protein